MQGDLKKFLFDVNIFDRPVPDPADAEPPPPTFSEQELEDAKRQAFAEGRKAGHAESAASREQMVAQILQSIAQNYPALLAEEQAREQRYEVEAVRLAQQVFEQILPHMLALFGRDELKKAMMQVLERQDTQSRILVEVDPGLVQDISDSLENAVGAEAFRARFEVAGRTGLDAHAFAMRWKDGGALHSIEKIAQDIRALMEQALAPFASTRHDTEKEG